MSEKRFPLVKVSIPESELDKEFDYAMNHLHMASLFSVATTTLERTGKLYAKMLVHYLQPKFTSINLSATSYNPLDSSIGQQLTSMDTPGGAQIIYYAKSSHYANSTYHDTILPELGIYFYFPYDFTYDRKQLRNVITALNFALVESCQFVPRVLANKEEHNKFIADFFYHTLLETSRAVYPVDHKGFPFTREMLDSNNLLREKFTDKIPPLVRDLYVAPNTEFYELGDSIEGFLQDSSYCHFIIAATQAIRDFQYNFFRDWGASVSSTSEDYELRLRNNEYGLIADSLVSRRIFNALPSNELYLRDIPMILDKEDSLMAFHRENSFDGLTWYRRIYTDKRLSFNQFLRPATVQQALNAAKRFEGSIEAKRDPNRANRDI